MSEHIELETLDDGEEHELEWVVDNLQDILNNLGNTSEGGGDIPLSYFHECVKDMRKLDKPLLTDIQEEKLVVILGLIGAADQRLNDLITELGRRCNPFPHEGAQTNDET